MMESVYSPLTPLFYFNLAFSMARLLFALAATVCLLCHWNKPYFKVRTPLIVLLSCIGIILLEIVLASLLFMSLADGSLSSHRST